MGYLSIKFLLLVAMTFLFYYLIPRKWPIRPLVLLAGSLVFYISFGIENFVFLLLTALTTYLSARLIKKINQKRLVFIFCVVVNIGTWFAIKVLPWLINTINEKRIIFNNSIAENIKSIIIPIGISYFTLQAIAYLIDVYREKIQPEKCFGKYLLFLSYFPAIVQGPISRYAQLMPQLLNEEKFSYDNFRKGLLLVLIGLAKKIVIADRLSIFVDHCFTSYSELSGIILYIGAVCYAIQLYMDFSGCVDICRGVSTLFNVELLKNFDRPYLAASIKDFWGRWHISLSSWLKDYIYIPLGGSRKGQIRKYINILITFLVSGLWHGAGFSFFFWGLLHAFYQIIGQATLSIRQKLSELIGMKRGTTGHRVLQIIITFNLVTFAWIFFRAGSLTEGFNYVARIFTNFRLSLGLFDLGVDFKYASVLCVNILVLLFVECRSKSQESALSTIILSPMIIRWCVFLLLIFDVIIFGTYGSGFDLTGFLYGGF